MLRHSPQNQSSVPGHLERALIRLRALIGSVYPSSEVSTVQKPLPSPTEGKFSDDRKKASQEGFIWADDESPLTDEEGDEKRNDNQEFNDDDSSYYEDEDYEYDADDGDQAVHYSLQLGPEYSQEPFDTFRHRVEDLCRIIWPHKQTLLERFASTRVASFLVEILDFFRRMLTARPMHQLKPMQGGCFNRIIGITTAQGRTSLFYKFQPGERMILRIPRFIWNRTDQQVALLRFIHSAMPQIPVPEVVWTDHWKSNPLRRPFIIYKRIPGRDLSRIKWSRLNHDQKCSIARQLGQVMKHMLRFRHDIAGVVDAFRPSEQKNGLKIVPMDLWSRDGPAVETEEEKTITGLGNCCHNLTKAGVGDSEFLSKLLSRRLVWEKQQGPWSTYQPRAIEAFHRLETIIKQMLRDGMFDGIDLCLCHRDLQPRNIMVDFSADGSANISGILDWDLAVIAPQYIGCTPPWWMWAEPGQFDEADETRARDTPADPDKAEIKRIFDAEAGREYFRYAYEPQYHWMRVALFVVENGLFGSAAYADVEWLEEEWGRLQREQNPRKAISSAANASTQDRTDQREKTRR